MAFITTSPLGVSSFSGGWASVTASQSSTCNVSMTTSPLVAPLPSRGYSPKVDEFFARDVTRQYIAKACPSGVPPIQCHEGATFDEPWESRTLKRQSQLRFRQMPTAVRLRNMYETRKSALISCHGCSHEESRVLNNPIMASAMLLGKAEAEKACNRYIESSGPAEDMMCRAVENQYMKAVNGSGVFTTACTDGQAKYEAYRMAVRGGTTAFRSKQYKTGEKLAAMFNARKMAIARNHICMYEDGLYTKYPRLAGSMRPIFGYYNPFVTVPVPPTPAENAMQWQLLIGATAISAALLYVAQMGSAGLP